MLMTRKRFRRELTAAMEAYRWERDQALSRAHQAEVRADKMLDDLVRARAHRDAFAKHGSRLCVLLECDDLFAYYRPRGDEYQRLAQRIVEALAGFGRDGRGDLRQTEGQRLLGLPPRDSAVFAERANKSFGRGGSS